jgi:hypothetical protein
MVTRALDVVLSKYVLVPVALILLLDPPRALDRFNRVDVVLAVLVVWFGYWTIRAVRSWSQQKDAYFGRWMIFSAVMALALFLKPFDAIIQRYYSSAGLMILATNAPGYELHTLDVDPYVGFHPRANCAVKGPMPLEQNPFYRDFDVRSGDHGFFVDDLDLDNPPAKKPGEFRIVLIGGSAAQGYGAQTNEHMVYRLLEKQLTERLAGARRVRVTNLALANATTYQNYIALNKWGHQLEPDLILSFSGVNDAFLPVASDMPSRYEGVFGLTRATWVTESPRLLDDLAKYYPSIRTSLLGIAIRVLNSPDIAKRAKQEYEESYAYPGGPSGQDRAARLYVHALKSIKRDFDGIPIAVAFQPYTMPSADFARKLQSVTDSVRREVDGYINDKWYFVDVQDEFRKRGVPSAEAFVTSVHLSNRGQQAATDVLADALLPVITASGMPAAPPRASH